MSPFGANLLESTDMVQPYIASAILEHSLHPSFCDKVEQWYLPLASKVVARAAQQSTPLLLGVQGAQGSGKSTLSDFLKRIFKHEFNLNCVVLSIDDFYLTQKERHSLSQSVHPLFITRGVPGTHDIQLLNDTLNQLIQLPIDGEVLVPRFSKVDDDRAPREQWTTVSEPVDIIILEGWCVGVSAQPEEDLALAINNLEQQEDEKGVWRKYVNQQLEGSYKTLFDRLDCMAVLQAPSFSCVFEWRLLQEQKLAVKLTEDGRRDESQKLLTGQQVKRFIAHYQRVTEYAISHLPASARWLMHLDTNHSIVSMEER